MMTMDVKGLRELDQLLVGLPMNIQRKILRGAVRQGANVTAKMMKELAPTAKKPYLRNPRTGAPFMQTPGTIKRSIRAVRARSKETAVLNRVGPIRKKPYYGPHDPFYWHILEFGSKYHRARPFLRPAFTFTTEAAIQRVKEAIERGLKREYKKMARRS